MNLTTSRLTLIRAFSLGASGITRFSELADFEVGGVFCGDDGRDVEVRCIVTFALHFLNNLVATKGYIQDVSIIC